MVEKFYLQLKQMYPTVPDEMLRAQAAKMYSEHARQQMEMFQNRFGFKGMSGAAIEDAQARAAAASASKARTAPPRAPKPKNDFDPTGPMGLGNDMLEAPEGAFRPGAVPIPPQSQGTPYKPGAVIPYGDGRTPPPPGMLY